MSCSECDNGAAPCPFLTSYKWPKRACVRGMFLDYEYISNKLLFLFVLLSGIIYYGGQLCNVTTTLIQYLKQNKEYPLDSVLMPILKTSLCNYPPINYSTVYLMFEDFLLTFVFLSFGDESVRTFCSIHINPFFLFLLLLLLLLWGRKV